MTDDEKKAKKDPPPFCDCPACDGARKAYGLVLAKCGLFPAEGADYLSKMFSRMKGLAESARSVCVHYHVAIEGHDPTKVEGFEDVVLAALALAFFKPGAPGEARRERILALAEKLAAVERQQDEVARGHAGRN